MTSRSFEKRSLAIESMVDAQHASARARLAADPANHVLFEAARIEEENNPTSWFHRNMLELKTQMEMPPITSPVYQSIQK